MNIGPCQILFPCIYPKMIYLSMNWSLPSHTYLTLSFGHLFCHLKFWFTLNGQHAALVVYFLYFKCNNVYFHFCLYYCGLLSIVRTLSTALFEYSLYLTLVTNWHLSISDFVKKLEIFPNRQYVLGCSLCKS